MLFGAQKIEIRKPDNLVQSIQHAIFESVKATTITSSSTKMNNK